MQGVEGNSRQSSAEVHEGVGTIAELILLMGNVGFQGSQRHTPKAVPRRVCG